MALVDNLTAAWELNEVSGNALDSHGSNELTDNNTVGSGTGLIYSLARDFDPAEDEGFSIADNASLSWGDIDVTYEIWFQNRATTGNGVYFSKGVGGAEFTLYREGTNISWYVNGTTRSGSVMDTNWHQLIVDHDSVANEIGLTLDGGTRTTTTHSTGGNDGAGDFAVGRSFYEFDGLIGPLRFWKRLLTSDERTELYNSGAGRDYAYISGGGGGAAIPALDQGMLLGGLTAMSGGLA